MSIRAQIIAHCVAMNDAGLNQGSSGNISVRVGNEILITPSAMAYADMTPEDIVTLSLDMPDPAACARKPSTEWPFHVALHRDGPEGGVVMHAHPAHCTALSMTRKPIPACHYMVALFGGADVRVADYALFGSAALSANIMTAIAGRNACLLANHGAVVTGPDLYHALWRLTELEALAQQYILSLQAGGPVLLSDDEISEALEAFAGYGR